MPSPRRMRLLMLATLAAVVFILFYSSGLGSGRDPDARTLQDFYHKTMNAMDAGGSGDGGQAVLNSQTGQRAGHIPADRDDDGDVDEDDERIAAQMQERLRAAEQKAKDKANEKAPRPDPPSNVVGVGSSAGGQTKDKDGVAAAAKAKAKAKGSDKDTLGDSKTEEVRSAKVQLESILNKAPVVIFSKTYCPFSKRAKGLLLEKYHITPEPYVVELDEHPLGSSLQDELLSRTGRRTVPNVMIGGVSIGGADDVVELDNSNRLVAKIESLGKEDGVDMVERFVSGSA